MTISDQNNLLFYLLRAALGASNGEIPPTEIDWRSIKDISIQQGITAIVLDGLERSFGSFLADELSFTTTERYAWYQCVFECERQNLVVNSRAKELTVFFKSCGRRSCVLKGPGNALYYPIPNHRQTGDIDIWVEGNQREIINEIMQAGIHINHVDVKHCSVDFCGDVPVEIHFIPSYSYNPIIGTRLNDWTKAQSKIQFALLDDSLGFAHPSNEFNLVYVLLHIYRHLFSEGVGLRQVVDYYCIIKSSDSAQRTAAFSTLCSFRMRRFVAGMMWVLNDIFHLENTIMLCSPLEKEGRFLLSEFISGAGFGRFDERNKTMRKDGYFIRGLMQFKKNLRFIFHYPQEVLWSPLWKLLHWGWRKREGYI